MRSLRVLAGKDEISIPKGARFKAIWDFKNDSDEAEDFSGRTARVKLKNIAEEFEDEELITLPLDCVVVEPLDANSNTIKGRIEIDIPKEETAKLKIPSSEQDPYGESGFYSIMTITFDNDELALIAKVRPIKTI